MRETRTIFDLCPALALFLFLSLSLHFHPINHVRRSSINSCI